MAFKFKKMPWFYMGMPIETEINIPQAAFEVTPRVSEMPNTEIRTEFLLMKTRATPGISKQSVIAGYYPTLSLSAGYNYRQGPQMPLGAKPSDGVF
jgi:hypothetical protein